MRRRLPLVSVGILTYNSGKFILDALNGVKAQTYKNIELIISDDFSTDNTINICKKWIADNESSFVSVRLLTIDHNTGINANDNRMLNACNGEWLIDCAGDDMLTPTCVEEFVDFINKHQEVEWVVGKVQQYQDTFEEENIIDLTASIFNDRSLYDLTAKQQLQHIVRKNTISAPAVFIKTQIVREVGGYDERFGNLEDYPLYVKLLEKGHKCYSYNHLVVYQRVHDKNVFSNTVLLFNYHHRKMDWLVKKTLCYKYITKREIVRSNAHMVVFWIMHKLHLEKRNTFNKTVYLLLCGLAALLTLDFRGIYYRVINGNNNNWE